MTQHLDIGPIVWAVILATVLLPLVITFLSWRELTQEERDDLYSDYDKID